MTLPEIELIVRAVIAEGSRLLLAQPAGEAWYFLPGGHIEPGEPAEVALRRELEEELGVQRVHVGGVLAIIENGYTDARGDHHELNLVYRVAVDDAIDGSREAHLSFRWLEKSELHEIDLRPKPVAELLGLGLDGPAIEVRTQGLA
ncbi:MAG: 8-oxo-dGTP diphosphatase [Nocardioidaceae bacterium]|nr:8-oxo-dGTP diphosphatase [Nocardioidaceae bacterium]